MENNGLSAMQFGNWQSLPSLTDAFNKASKGEFNPLAAAIGYGISKFTGDNDVTRGLQSQGAQAPIPTPANPAVPQAMAPVVPQAVPPAAPSAAFVTGVQQPIQTFGSHPLVNFAQQLLGGTNAK